jgi:hypothetical protein
VTTITEGRLAFEFPAGWTVCKYDEWTFFVEHFQKVCDGAKGMDIVAVAPNGCLWLIEIKDYRAGPRDKPMELAVEIAHKVRDTLAGIAAARVRANVEAERSAAERSCRCGDIKVVLHLEQPATPTRTHPIEDASKLRQKLKQLLRGIDPHPKVVSMAEGSEKFRWTVQEV